MSTLDIVTDLLASANAHFDLNPFAVKCASLGMIVGVIRGALAFATGGKMDFLSILGRPFFLLIIVLNYSVVTTMIVEVVASVGTFEAAFYLQSQGKRFDRIRDRKVIARHAAQLEAEAGAQDPSPGDTKQGVQEEWSFGKTLTVALGKTFGGFPTRSVISAPNDAFASVFKTVERTLAYALAMVFLAIENGILVILQILQVFVLAVVIYFGKFLLAFAAIDKSFGRLAWNWFWALVDVTAWGVTVHMLLLTISNPLVGSMLLSIDYGPIASSLGVPLVWVQEIVVSIVHIILLVLVPSITGALIAGSQMNSLALSASGSLASVAMTASSRLTDYVRHGAGAVRSTPAQLADLADQPALSKLAESVGELNQLLGAAPAARKGD